MSPKLNPAASWAAAPGCDRNAFSTPVAGTGASGFSESRPRTVTYALLLGFAMLALSIVLGRSFVYYGLFLAFSVVLTLAWGKKPRPFTLLASVSAATPISIAKQQFTCNLIYGIWFALLNPRELSKLPRWLYLIALLALSGVLLSAVNWIGDNPLGGLLRQGAMALNFVIGPMLLLPMIYRRLEQSRDPAANLSGLLYGLILPSTVILMLARCFGRITNAYEASLHFGGSTEGFFQYQFGKVIVNFLRTEVGFILAALICASAAVAFSDLRPRYRWVARGCLGANAFMLLSTASFGSSFACLCGLTAIFTALSRRISVWKVFAAVAAIFGMLATAYVFSPQSIKKYLEQRYQHRVVHKDTDRVELWLNGIDYYIEHPMGVGFTLFAGDRVKTAVHNDYLAYTLSYSVFGGTAYTALVGGVLLFFLRKRRRLSRNPYALATYLAGHGVIIVIALNSITDHMAENRWYFNLIWSLVWYSYFCSRTEHEFPDAASIPASTRAPFLGKRGGLRHVPAPTRPGAAGFPPPVAELRPCPAVAPERRS